MINPIFKKYDFLYNYFEAYFKTGKRFPQSIVFEGQDTLSAYFFATELARILNCTIREAGERSTSTSEIETCTCTNCNWIKEGKHPAVISVTPIDFKEDNTKTVISVKQTEKITSLINEMSSYHRFFIFSNAKVAPYTALEQNKISKYSEKGYTIPTENWYPAPLNRKILQEEASNSLLKSTEEAPDGVTFVFLTNTRENIISTIVSRSLVFKIPSVYEKSQIDVSEFFINYPNISIDAAISLAKRFQEKIDNENLDIINALDAMEEYLTARIKAGGNSAILDDIKKIETAKKWLLATVQPKYAIESLFISLSNEGKNL